MREETNTDLELLTSFANRLTDDAQHAEKFPAREQVVSIKAIREALEDFRGQSKLEE